MESSGVLSIAQFAYRKGLDTYEILLSLSHALQSALDSRQEAGIVQIDFSTAFDRGNHKEFSMSCVLWVLEVMCCLY